MRDLRRFQSEIENLAGYFQAEPDVLTVYIFGSFGTESQTTLSDLDVAILFERKLSLMEELRHAAEISSLLKMEKVDLLNLNTAPVRMQHRVLRQGQKIFERFPEKTQDFVEQVLEIYHDYQGIFRKYQEDFHAGLIGEYLDGR
jgi:predicted nucleotidyltransferase